MEIFKKKLQLLKLIIVVATVSFFFISCKKKETVIAAQSTETAPISTAFFVNGQYTITSPLTGGNSGYEIGCVFSVAKTGKILKLGARMPTAGTYRVTLWTTDAVPQTPLAQATVTQSADGVTAFSSITPVSVTTGKTYLISLWSSLATKLYYIQPASGTNIVYPITSGNITITGYRFITTAKDPIQYPTTASTLSVSGFADIEFKAD